MAISAHENAMTRSNVSPVDSILTDYCLKLHKLPVERVVAHRQQQLCGGIHPLDDIAGNITMQAGGRAWRGNESQAT